MKERPSVGLVGGGIIEQKAGSQESEELFNTLGAQASMPARLSQGAKQARMPVLPDTSNS
jgi:hypothetical protein